jgi:hypothetical protein
MVDTTSRRLLRELVPTETDSEESMRRAWHRDIGGLTPEDAWAELTLLKPHLARLVWQRRRAPRRVVRVERGCPVTELQWTHERIKHLERVLSRRGRAA